MIVVLRGEIAFQDGGIGDLAALFSGIAWSAGAALVFATDGDKERQIPRLGLAVMISAVVTSLVLLPLEWQGWPSLDNHDVAAALLLALGAGALYLAPIIGVTLWGATRLPPATISFLLAAEILSGIASSALFLDERFGWWEVTGTFMIISGVIAHIAIDSEETPRTE
jgi:drug/metabolite transporter (DMT)-like permease